MRDEEHREHREHRSSKLTKQPPLNNAAFNARMSQNNVTAQLRRQPSIPQQSSYYDINGRDHAHQPPHVAADFSFNRSPNLASSKTDAHTPPEQPTDGYSYPSRQSWDEKTSDELNGAAHDTLGGLSKISSSKSSGYQNSSRRPGPPPLSHTSPDTRMTSPALRQSASFSVGDRSGDVTPPRSDTGLTTPKRYSDEASGGRNSAPWKKKSGFSSFMNSVLGSPRTVKISHPENPVHVTHVGFDNVTGQFTVRKNNCLFRACYRTFWLSNLSILVKRVIIRACAQSCLTGS